MPLNTTHINYFHICHRKLWLFANGINMEQTSNTVADDKMLMKPVIRNDQKSIPR